MHGTSKGPQRKDAVGGWNDWPMGTWGREQRPSGMIYVEGSLKETGCVRDGITLLYSGNDSRLAHQLHFNTTLQERASKKGWGGERQRGSEDNTLWCLGDPAWGQGTEGGGQSRTLPWPRN